MNWGIKAKLLAIHQLLKNQLKSIMALNGAMIDFALDKYGEVVWNMDDDDEFDETIDEDWERRFPNMVYARKHKGIRSPEGGIYLARIWRKGNDVRVDGYGYKGKVCNGWKSDDVVGMADFVCDVCPDVYDAFKQDINDSFVVYNRLMREFVDAALSIKGNKVSVNRDFYDFGLPCALQVNVDYFVGLDDEGKKHLFIPKCIYRLDNEIYSDGELLRGGQEVRKLRIGDLVNVFRIVYSLIFGKDYLHPIIGWQICMIPDGYLLGSDRVLLSERWMADLLCQKASGDWFVLNRKVMDDEVFSDFVFRDM